MSDAVLGAWAQHLRSEGKSEATIKAYIADIERYDTMPAPGYLWTPRYNGARSRLIRTSGLSPRTIARHLASHAAYCRFIGQDPAYFLERPKVGVVLPGVVPMQEEMRRFIDAETDVMWRALWAAMCGAGLRVSEVVSLKWSDVEGGKFRVLGKGSKLRDVPMSDEVCEYLRKWARDCPAELHMIFPVNVRAVQRRVKVVARAAGLPETWHPHAMRHGFATAALESCGDLRVVADLLGHSSMTTAMIYTHVRDPRRAVAVAGIL